MATDTDFSSLSLFLATPAQTVESYRRTTKEWGRGQTEEQYIRHNQSQAKTFECTKGRKWVVCYQRTGLILERNAASPKEVTCYGIASVFTPPSERGKGYARHMTRLLHWVLSQSGSLPPSSFPEEWGSPPPRVESAGNGCFSALWSDVGHFYQNCGPFGQKGGGWRVKDAKSTIWEVEQVTDDDPADIARTRWDWLNEDTVEHIWRDDVDVIRAELASLGPNQDKTFFTFLPSLGVESFQREKLKFLWEKEGITQWGVTVHRSEESLGIPDFATWTVLLSGPTPRTLLITRLRAHGDTFPIILSRAVEVAKKHDLQRIEVWNLAEQLQRSGAPGATFVRDDHLPAVQWYGSANEGELVWLNNEKYIRLHPFRLYTAR
ncbi:hypothetical protein AAF712_012348 [Marasmius tenuissimus]|uniref:LYC1 C-terminal domain-containing protein n=1 Tax=Marasmius tenuissimus TaxID=585030 RepID=A0ABR2ZIV3_9AGAR